MKTLVMFLLASSVALLMDEAQAAIVPAHDPTIIGNGLAPDDGMNLTFDTSTNLEWLDITLSLGVTTNAALAELGPGGIFAGFSHASNAQVIQLFQNMGLATGNYPGFTSLADGGVLADAAIDILGESGVTSNGIRFSQGTTTDMLNATNQRVAVIRDDGVTSTTAANGGVGTGTAGFQIGHFLIRSVVPEPATMSLVLMGGLGFLCRRHRRV